MIESKDLIPGTIYFQRSTSTRSNTFVTLYTGEANENFIHIADKRFAKGGTSAGVTTERLATEEEIEWLRSCIAADKYIPFEKLFPRNTLVTLRATRDQFECVLKFLAIFGTDILQHSPEYIIEKYERFIGPISDNINGEIIGGIHPILQKGIVDRYMDIWQPKFKES